MNPSSMPSVAIPRSRWIQEFNHSTSFLHGQIIPLDCFPVLPGDDYTVKKAAQEIIMSTPIVPIMGNIKVKVCAFFVPMRLLWENTEQFFGANKTSAGPQTGSYNIPNESVYATGVKTDSVSHYLGKPIVPHDASKLSFGRVSVLKERGYWMIWDSWYRAQQLQAPFIMNTGNSGSIGTIGGTNKNLGSSPANCCKQVDMFTAATLSPQYGAAVALPLGSYAPIIPDTTQLIPGEIKFKPYLNGTTGKLQTAAQNLTGQTVIFEGDSGSGDLQVASTNLIADLSNATAAKVNDIRYAFQLQKYLERANYGSRFFEVLAVHYGITSPDSRLQRPEYLGGKTSPLSIRTVMSTAGYDVSVNQKVGQPGACSITMIDLSGLFSKGFVEPGYVYILCSTNHERSYSQGLLQEDTKFSRWEIYSPEFANLGDQEIKNKHLMLTGDASDEQTFGYQGHWDEYRYRRNRVSGLLDPAASGALSYWTLAEKFTSRPSLSASFIEENRDCLSRCLVTGATGPDYISDVYIQYQTTREMPMYAIPGLIDHFGAL